MEQNRIPTITETLMPAMHGVMAAAMIVAGGVALVLAATKVEMMIESLLQRMARSTLRAGADKSD